MAMSGVTMLASTVDDARKPMMTQAIAGRPAGSMPLVKMVVNSRQGRHHGHEQH